MPTSARVESIAEAIRHDRPTPEFSLALADDLLYYT